MSGLFITFEGGEGAGKSTQIRALRDKIESQNLEVVLTREPGGSKGAEVLRHVLLSGGAQAFGPKAEVLMFAAARLDHIEHTIKPALDRGAVVLCDRFFDSTRAYQGNNRQSNEALVGGLERIVASSCCPDLTILLDIDPKVGLARVEQRLQQTRNHAATENAVDRFEKDSLEIHEKRRQQFLEIAKANPERCKVIDANEESDNVSIKIWNYVQPILSNFILPDNVSTG